MLLTFQELLGDAGFQEQLFIRQYSVLKCICFRIARWVFSNERTGFSGVADESVTAFTLSNNYKQWWI
jgi:hypothetical protein